MEEEEEQDGAEEEVEEQDARSPVRRWNRLSVT